MASDKNSTISPTFKPMVHLQITTPPNIHNKATGGYPGRAALHKKSQALRLDVKSATIQKN